MTARDLHLLTHAARLVSITKANPKHPRAREYQQQFSAYKLRWSALTLAERKATIAAAGTVPDSTKPGLAAAVAALEA